MCEQVVVENLKDPMQLTVPLADRADAKTKCTGQPDARSQLKGLLNNEPACKETLECRYWDEDNLQWSTEGCVTTIYNGTDGSAFTGCECSHLSEFVSVTVPTDAFGDVEFGSIDVADGSLTHVSGERGGMWLTVHKEAARTPTKAHQIHLAFADEAAAPQAWEVLNVTCPQGRPPPAGASGFANTSVRPDLDAISHCYWARATRLRGKLADPMGIELSGSGLAENRDAEAYAAHITYALYADIQFKLKPIRDVTPDLLLTRSSLISWCSAYATESHIFTSPLHASVLAVPVAARSVRGLVPPGQRCDAAAAAANGTRVVSVELGRSISVIPAGWTMPAGPYLQAPARWPQGHSSVPSTHRALRSFPGPRRPYPNFRLLPPVPGAVLSLRSRGLPHLSTRRGWGTARPLKLAAARRRAAQPAPTNLRRGRI